METVELEGTSSSEPSSSEDYSSTSAWQMLRIPVAIWMICPMFIPEVEFSELGKLNLA